MKESEGNNGFFYFLERTVKDEDWHCAADPCKNGGTCKEKRSGCVCRLGFVGDYCEGKLLGLGSKDQESFLQYCI